MAPMPRRHPNATTEPSCGDQLFWDQVFCVAYADALRRNGKRDDVQRITWAAARADGAVAERRRSQQERRP